MDSFTNSSPLFDLSQASTFSQLPDDDFLALLQKQFPGSAHNNNLFGGFDNAINPQSLSHFTLPTMSPSSENSSPSPPNTNKGDNKQSSEEAEEQSQESALKRKASDDDFEEGPSQKNQHTASGSSTKKGSATKRKSTGGTGDESRLLKRKEQNRAAQRAFRERKEKHVRDLEEQVAALEAKNEATTSENENLRDLLTRLQSENMTLRQQAQSSASASASPASSSFTFSVPKPSTTSAKSPQYLTENSLFSTLPRTTYSSPDPNHLTPLDMSSMMTFNPSVLNLLDETPQQTATDGAMEMDFGFGTPSNSNNNKNDNNNSNGGWLPSNLTTISTNPAYFSLASMFESPPAPSAPTPPSVSATTSTTSPASAPANINKDQSAFGFDFNSLTQWPATTNDAGTLDDLFGGYFNPQPPMDVDSLLRSPPSSISPVAHYNAGSPSSSTSSSPASHASDPSIFSMREGSSSESEAGHDDGSHFPGSKECPKSREELRKAVATSGSSPFVETKSCNPKDCAEAIKAASEPSMFVSSDIERQLLQSVACQKGSSGFPSTEKSDNNVEVLTAWRSLTMDPSFKECDITKLCTEFTSKARCDGSKVVLPPSEVQHIRESLSRKH
ncbi:DNA-binding transcription factor yap1 [Marasmius crinis-equi]|uniref:DNA-binding transcription factor yap1 n=1 Tax=Marasmius crinis-equi TaxID=585013 RepID=A0ABR3FQE3_9AGAR